MGNSLLLTAHSELDDGFFFVIFKMVIAGRSQ